ncbi:hypothetical protein [Streptomyces abikoensis]|uniref:Uncharacterized protein n=1 Tax=Streptomyces abikoensis TaxID=97398 RepID=A0ABW7TCQ6_9ACTN
MGTRNTIDGGHIGTVIQAGTVHSAVAQGPITREQRREDFELAHLKDLYEELCGLLLVAENNILQWCEWHRLREARPTRRRSQEDIDTARASCFAEAQELEKIAQEHSRAISRLAGLVLIDRLRDKVTHALGYYEYFEVLLPEDGSDAEAALPGTAARLTAAKDAVAARIRGIYLAGKHERV